MSTVEGASHSPQQSFSFFLKLLLNPRWLTLWRFLYCHPPLVYFGFSTKLWRWQFGRSAPIQPIMSCSFDSLLTWQTKLAPDKWSKDKTTENSTHWKCAFSAIIYKLKKKWSLSFSLDCIKEAVFLNLVYLQIASTFGSTDPLSSTQETRTNWPRQVCELILDSDSWSQGVKGQAFRVPGGQG